MCHVIMTSKPVRVCPCRYYDSLASLGGNLRLVLLPTLRSVDGVNKLGTVGGMLGIERNADLASVDVRYTFDLGLLSTSCHALRPVHTGRVPVPQHDALFSVP